MFGLSPKALCVAAFAATLCSPSTPIWAQEPALSLELNAAEPSEKGCRLIFVISNGLGSDLSKAAFEIVLFDKAGVVDRISVLEFKDLVKGKTKVSRFDLSGADCANLGRVLVNSVSDCAGEAVTADLCARSLKTTTKSEIGFGT